MSVVDDRPDLRRLVDRDAAEKAQRRASSTGCAPGRTSTTASATPQSRTPGSAPRGGAATPRGQAGWDLRTPGTAASSSGAATPRFPPSAGDTRSGPRPQGTIPTPRGAPPVSLPLPAGASTQQVEDTAEARNLRSAFDQFAAFGRSQGTGEGTGRWAD